jgi:hypothetical protein
VKACRFTPPLLLPQYRGGADTPHIYERYAAVDNTYELVFIDGVFYVVKHEENTTNRDSCVAYLRDSGHTVNIVDNKPIKTTTYNELSDLVEPRDE